MINVYYIKYISSYRCSRCGRRWTSKSFDTLDRSEKCPKCQADTEPLRTNKIEIREEERVMQTSLLLMLHKRSVSGQDASSLVEDFIDWLITNSTSVQDLNRHKENREILAVPLPWTTPAFEERSTKLPVEPKAFYAEKLVDFIVKELVEEIEKYLIRHGSLKFESGTELIFADEVIKGILKRDTKFLVTTWDQNNTEHEYDLSEGTVICVYDLIWINEQIEKIKKRGT